MTSSPAKTTPFAVLLATFSSDASSRLLKSQFVNFLVPGGNGLYDFLADISHGRVDLGGSEVFGWYTLQLSSPDAVNALKKGTPVQDAWMDNAIKVAAANNVDFSPFYGVIVVVDNPKGNSITAIGRRLPLGKSETQSGDPWNAIAAAVVNMFDSQVNLTGEGLNTPILQKLGWLSEDRIFTARSSSLSTTVKLTALNHPNIPGYLMTRVLTLSSAYAAEFRPPSLWSTGNMSKATVLIYELTHNSPPAGNTQDNWRRCNKCQCLAYAGNAICAAGGVHDHSMSRNYSLSSDSSKGQSDWRWCKNCQELSFYGKGAIGECPAGGTHDDTGSDNYSISLDDPSASGQDNWKRCDKCHGMAYAGNPSAGPCAAGGDHTHTGSGTYTIASTGGQDSWRWCSKCQMLAYDGYSHCAAGGAHTYVGSANYTLSFGEDDNQDNVSLVQSLSEGGVFSDAKRSVKITVGSIDTAAMTVTLTFG